MIIDQVISMRPCPICKVFPEPKEGRLFGEYNIELRCPRHPGYVANGYTEAGAWELWNAFIRHTERDTIFACALNPGALDTSPCLTCKRETKSDVKDTSDRYVVFCTECHLPKYEREGHHGRRKVV